MRPKPLLSLTAPGVRSAKLDQRPLLMGKLEMAFSSTTLEKSCEVVLTMGISAVTSMVVPAEATLSLGEISVTLPIWTTTCSALYGAKPEASIVIVYVVGASLPIRKYPVSSVVVDSEAFVPLFFAVTVAPAIPAPEESITVPPTAPSVVDCALTRGLKLNTLAAQKDSTAIQVKIRLAFINSS